MGYDKLIVHINKSGAVTPHQVAQALRSGASHSYQVVVSGASTPPKSTNTPVQSIDSHGTATESCMKEMYVNRKPKKSQKSISSPRGFPASLLVWLDNDWDFKTPEEHSFLKLLGFLPTKDPDIFYSKTLRAYYLMTAEKLSRQYLGFLPTSGIELNGKFLIRRAGSPRIERGYSLSDILERNPDERYFLSEKMMAGLMKGFAKPQMLDALTGEDIQVDITHK